MDMLPPQNFWNPPAEVRSADCSREEPCWRAPDGPRRLRPAPESEPDIQRTLLTPGTGSLKFNAPAVFTMA